jgi:hypothetical protein
MGMEERLMEDTIKVLGYVALGAMFVAAVATGVTLAREIPGIARYVKIWSM